MGKNTAAIFFIFFLGAALAVTLWRLPIESRGEVINGEWMKNYEAYFGEKSAFTAPSKAIWARFEKGKREVVFGDQGQYYTAEEFRTSHQDPQLYLQHIEYITRVRDALKKEKTELLIAVIPSKARMENADDLPEAKKRIASAFEKDMAERQIATIMLSDIEFFKADTHWSTKGAKEAARQIASRLEHGQENFENRKTGEKVYRGDLTKFISGDMLDEQIAIYELSGGKTADLFADENVPVVLVGTSYSAKKEFNFENFLKQYLKRDVLNFSDEGRGPFKVMKDYLAEKTYEPELVIWEIPERYLTMHLE